MEDDINAGTLLQKKRKRVEHTCPDCGVNYTAYTTSLRCKKCARKIINKRHREKIKNLTTIKLD
jgi:predicted RNA-binding Zn-ribbon protein involved in translation (DUF1610 family)